MLDKMEDVRKLGKNAGAVEVQREEQLIQVGWSEVASGRWDIWAGLAGESGVKGRAGGRNV